MISSTLSRLLPEWKCLLSAPFTIRWSCFTIKSNAKHCKLFRKCGGSLPQSLNTTYIKSPGLAVLSTKYMSRFPALLPEPNMQGRVVIAIPPSSHLSMFHKLGTCAFWDSSPHCVSFLHVADGKYWCLNLDKSQWRSLI